MDEAVSAAAVPDQQNEEYSEAEVLTEGSSGAPEDMYLDSSDNLEVNEYQDAEAISHAEVPKYMFLKIMKFQFQDL